jgi:hypothetical protein
VGTDLPRGACGRALGVREVDERLARADLEEHLVQHRRRVHDEVRAARVGRPVAAARELAGVRKRVLERRRGAAGSDDDRALGGEPEAVEDHGVGREPFQPIVSDEERVD